MGLLVLSRHPNEKIYITCPNGDMVEIVVTDIDRNKVRIGISALPAYKIEREEIMVPKKHTSPATKRKRAAP